MGYIRSGNYGHSLGGSIGLGYVDRSRVGDLAGAGAGTCEIEVAGVRVPAEASLRPMYDPDNSRIRC